MITGFNIGSYLLIYTVRASTFTRTEPKVRYESEFSENEQTEPKTKMSDFSPYTEVSFISVKSDS